MKILIRTLVISSVIALVVALIVVNPGSSRITFALEEGLNLIIGSSASRNGVPIPGSSWALKDLTPGADKFFDLDSVMPGDSGQATISMEVDSRRGDGVWMCLGFSNLQSDDNGVIEPEADVDPNGDLSGELADEVEFFAWHDDGDNVFEVNEKPLFTASPAALVLDSTYIIADTTTEIPVEAGETRYVGITWCAGALSVNLTTAEILCDPLGLGNEAQTDSLSVDVSIHAELSRGRDDFTCSGEDAPNGRERPERPERPDRPERGV